MRENIVRPTSLLALSMPAIVTVLSPCAPCCAPSRASQPRDRNVTRASECRVTMCAPNKHKVFDQVG